MSRISVTVRLPELYLSLRSGSVNAITNPIGNKLAYKNIFYDTDASSWHTKVRE